MIKKNYYIFVKLNQELILINFDIITINDIIIQKILLDFDWDNYAHIIYYIIIIHYIYIYNV